jgi:hypothetical protein
MKIEVTSKEAPRLLDWLTNRGGVAIWESRDLRSAGNRTFTPARTTTGEPTTAPGWQWSTTPVEVVTDRADIGVYDETLYKAFPVSLRRSGNGLSLKLTDPSQRKVDKVMQECAAIHGNSHYHKGVLPDKAASIGVYYASEVQPL